MLGLGNSMTQVHPCGSDFLPSDIDGLEFWFGSDNSSEEMVVKGTAISNWEPRNTTSYRLNFAASAASRPTLHGSGVVIFGIDKFLSLLANSDDSNNELTFDTSDGGWTVMIIAAADNWGDPTSQVIARALSPSDGALVFAGDDRITMNVDNESHHFTTDTAPTDGEYISIMIACESNGNMTCYINNVAQADTESLSSTSKDLKLISLGSSSGAFVGGVKQFLAWNQAFDGATRDNLHTWASSYID